MTCLSLSRLTVAPCSCIGWRHGLQAVSVVLASLFFLGMFYRSASLYHPQRRAILHLKVTAQHINECFNSIGLYP